MNIAALRSFILNATSMAHHVRIRCGINRTAAVDPYRVAETRNCEVRFAPLPSLEGVYSPKPKPVIILGSQRPAGRRAFTCAHELGHHEFKHGARIDELNVTRFDKSKKPEEMLADMFAASLLMSRASILRALKNRGIQLNHIQPLHLFRLASFLGVGYTTLIEHMTWTLRLLNSTQRSEFIKTKPKDLKSQYGGSSQSEVVLVDELWLDRAVDLEIGDILVLPQSVIVEENHRISPNGNIDTQQTFKAVSRGYLRAYVDNNKWAVNIRVAPRHYEGLVQYRFMDDPEEINNESS